MRYEQTQNSARSGCGRCVPAAECAINSRSPRRYSDRPHGPPFLTFALLRRVSLFRTIRITSIRTSRREPYLQLPDSTVFYVLSLSARRGTRKLGDYAANVRGIAFD